MEKILGLKNRFLILASAFMSIFVGLADAEDVYGTFPSVYNLSSLNGKNGFAINGTELGSLGFGVKGAGDVNGDGVADMLFFALDENMNNKVYVVFGSEEPWPASISLDNLEGDNGFIITGMQGGYPPTTACGVGDVNNDGIDDVLIGDAFANEQSGQSYVVFGSKSPWLAELDIDDLDGSNGFAINGISSNDFSGSYISGIGDMNGDGIGDILIGTGLRNVENAKNQMYVVFGREVWPAVIDLGALAGQGFIINGVQPNDGGAYSISGVGDVNGDGVNDIVIGDPWVNNYTGRSYVLFGKKGVWPEIVRLELLNGRNGFAINGINEGDYSGTVVSGVGDVNLDGLDDILVNALWANKYGQTYVVFGNRGPWLPAINLTSLNGKNGCAINGVPGSGGYTMSGLGDVNKDGIDDIIIGESWVNNEIGQSFVVFGKKGAWSPVFNLTSLNATSGFVINGINVGDWSGDSVSGVGDVNKGGVADIFLGASQANNASGQAYIIFGEDMLDMLRRKWKKP